jgi:CHRD domain
VAWPRWAKLSSTVIWSWARRTVVAIAGQNVVAGDFDALVDALKSNTAYANIHTTTFGAGEIRGQIRRDNGRGNNDKDHDDKDHDK